MMFNILL